MHLYAYCILYIVRTHIWHICTKEHTNMCILLYTHNIFSLSFFCPRLARFHPLSIFNKLSLLSNAFSPLLTALVFSISSIAGEILRGKILTFFQSFFKMEPKENIFIRNNKRIICLQLCFDLDYH